MQIDKDKIGEEDVLRFMALSDNKTNIKNTTKYVPKAADSDIRINDTVFYQDVINEPDNNIAIALATHKIKLAKKLLENEAIKQLEVSYHNVRMSKNIIKELKKINRKVLIDNDLYKELLEVILAFYMLHVNEAYSSRQTSSTYRYLVQLIRFIGIIEGSSELTSNPSFINSIWVFDRLLNKVNVVIPRELDNRFNIYDSRNNIETKNGELESQLKGTNGKQEEIGRQVNDRQFNVESKDPEIIPPSRNSIIDAIDEIDNKCNPIFSEAENKSNSKRVIRKQGAISKFLQYMFGSKEVSEDENIALVYPKVKDIELSKPTLDVVSYFQLFDHNSYEAIHILNKHTAGNYVTKIRNNPKTVMIGSIPVQISKRPEDFMNPFDHFGPHEIISGLDKQVWKIKYGELMIIRKKLIGYTMHKWSQVENVLAGEERKREHRSKIMTEEQVRQLKVIEKEQVRDLQQTEKTTLQSELSRQTALQLNAEVGAEVSGSYGPTIEFSASAGIQIGHSSETASRNVQGFSRQVTDRTTESIRERKEEELITRRLTEVEETNIHSFNNNGSKHIRGVYRWINELYRAQVYNLGFRYMVDLVIPMPAANFMRLIAEGKVGESLTVEEPQEMSLGPNDSSWISEWGNQALEYEVNIPAPPKAFHWLSLKANATPDSKENYRWSHSEKLTIPDGYMAKSGKLRYSKMRKNNNFYITSLVGADWMGRKNGEDQGGYPNLKLFGQTDELSFAIQSKECRSLIAGGQVRCDLTPSKLKEWQAEAYEAVLQGYKAKKMAYNAALEEALENQKKQDKQSINQHIRGIEKTIRSELQRLFLSAVTETNIEGFDPFLSDDINAWKYDWRKVSAISPQIALMHQCFEWNNMSFVFYTYFWGKQVSWASSIKGGGCDDALMAEFLKAGAVRVQVPIRPAMTLKAFKAFNFGALPFDFDIEHNDEVDMITELLEASDHPDNAQPVGKSWPFELPTSLVILEEEDNLALFDSLSVDPNDHDNPNNFVKHLDINSITKMTEEVD